MIKSTLIDTAEEKLSEFEDRQKISSSQEKNTVTIYGDRCQPDFIQ